MTAAHILTRWKRVQPILKATRRSSAETLFFGMLEFADGCRTARELAERMPCSLPHARNICVLLERAGVIRSTSQSVNGRNCFTYETMPALYSALALNPTSPTPPAS
jgi:hypothetical protein